MRKDADKSCRENENTLFMCGKFFFFPKIFPFMRKCGEKKCCRAGQATDDNMTHAHWMLDT